VVWFCDVSDDKTNKRIDGTICQSESTALALKRFNCYRVNVLAMPEGRLKKEYSKLTPSFLFFNPDQAPVGKPLRGRKATSLSAFTAHLESTWSRSFTMRLKDYQKKMKCILDRYDKLDSRKQVLDKDREKLEKRPHAGKTRKLDMEEAKLEKVRTKVEQDEKAILDACALRPEFLPDAGSDR